MTLYTVYDSAAEDSSPPFLSKNDAVAYRSYTQFLSSVPKHLNPSDFKLYAIGEYDPSSMVVSPLPKPLIVEVVDVPK